MRTLILLVVVLGLNGAFVPYLGTDGNFHFNYTGACVNSTPMVGYTLTTDSLSVDSLLQIYPSVVLMDSVSFGALLLWGETL